MRGAAASSFALSCMRTACGSASARGRAPAGLLGVLLAALLTRIVAQPPVPSAVSVTTPAELQQAVRAGTAHILVTEHLDLSQIEEPDSDSALFTSDKSWKSTTLSVRGNCTVPPQIPPSLEPPLLPLRRGQCLMQTQRQLFHVAQPDSRRPFWLDNLYMRSEVWNEVVWQQSVEVQWSLWLSRLTLQDVTLQGEPVTLDKSFLTLGKGANLFVQDCDFRGMTAPVAPINVGDTDSDTVASFEGCSFDDIGVEAENRGVITVTDALLRFARSTFSNITHTRGDPIYLSCMTSYDDVIFTDLDFWSKPSGFFSESPGQIVALEDGGDLVEWLNATSPALMQLRQEADAAALVLQTTAPPQVAPVPPDATDSVPAAAIGGAVAATVLAIGGLVAATLLCKRRSARARKEAAAEQRLGIYKSHGGAGASDSAAGPSGGVHSYSSEPSSAPKALAVLGTDGHGGSRGQSSMCTSASSADKTGTDQSGCDASVAPATTGGKDAQDRLVTAIVNMSAAQPQVLFAGAWLLTAGMVHGGQGIVAFARGRDAGMRQYAIKFCLDHSDFEREVAFYEQEVFRACLPGLVRATTNADGAVVSRTGYPFPPFMVLDRGVTLSQWLEDPRSPGAVLVMAAEVLELLVTLHASGSVHRDIKPGNLLLVLHTLKWRLLDFGIVAPVGKTGRVACTLPYAPPEAVNAHAAGAELTVQPSLDMWAIGVVMYEALTGTPPFPRFFGTGFIAQCATGEALYPWEAPLDETPSAWSNARMRPIVEPCLARDPEQRPTALQLLHSIRRLDHMTTAPAAT